MAKSKNTALKLGILVAAGLVLFSVAIYYLGSKQNLFSSTVNVKSYFNDVNGLLEGNKVQYSGITVGYVSHIEIVEDTVILVEMSVDKSIREYIRKDSKVEIVSDGLMGSKIISINPGTAGKESISDKDFLLSKKTIDMQDIMEEAKRVMEESQLITQNLLEISNKINNGDGDLSALLNKNTITTKLNQAGDEMLRITSDTHEIIQKINNGKGDLGRLANDTIITGAFSQLTAKIDSVAHKSNLMADQLLQFSKALNSGEGILPRLVYDTAMANTIDTTFTKVNNGVNNVIGAAQTVESSWIFNLFSKDKNN